MGADYIKDLLVFARVVERKSFTDAAGDLRLSVSAVSRHVTQLEKTLGVQLLKRTTRRLAITDIGLDYYTQCSQAISALEQARAAAVGHSMELRGQLRVRSTIGIGHRLVLPVINEFLAKYSEFSIELTINVKPVTLIGLDVLVGTESLPVTNVSCRDLGPLRYTICAAPSYLAKHGRPTDPQGLKKMNCLIHTEVPGPNRWRIHHDKQDFNITVRGSLQVNNGAALYEFLQKRLGIRPPSELRHRR